MKREKNSNMEEKKLKLQKVNNSFFIFEFYFRFANICNNFFKQKYDQFKILKLIKKNMYTI